MFLDHHQARNAHNQGYRTLDPLKLNFADLPVAVVGHNQGYRTLDPLKLPPGAGAGVPGHGITRVIGPWTH